MYASHIRQLTEILNQTNALGLGTLGNAIFARKLYTILADGPLQAVAGIIIGRMKIDLPATIFTDSPEDMEQLVNTFGELITKVYMNVRDYMTVEHADEYIIEAASSFNVSIS